MKPLIKLASTAILCAVSVLAQADTIKFAVTDLVGMEELQREFGKFVEVLEEKTGHDVKFYPVTNRTAAVEALRFKKVDFVMTGPAEYVVIKKRTNAEIVVGFSRPDYFATVITLANSPYNTVQSLKDQKVAFGSVGSTSKHLGPLQAMADYGLGKDDIDPFNTKITVGWEALKKGDVAAVGMNHLNFLKLRNKEANKEGGLPPGAFRVVARGPDLPNDVLMAGSHVDPKLVAKMKQVFVDNSDELIAAILSGDDNKKYSGMKFLTNLQDSNYNYVRSMYATAGYPEYAEFIGD